MTEIACQYRTLILHGLALVMHRKCGKEIIDRDIVDNSVGIMKSAVFVHKTARWRLIGSVQLLCES